MSRSSKLERFILASRFWSSLPDGMLPHFYTLVRRRPRRRRTGTARGRSRIGSSASSAYGSPPGLGKTKQKLLHLYCDQTLNLFLTQHTYSQNRKVEFSRIRLEYLPCIPVLIFALAYLYQSLPWHTYTNLILFTSSLTNINQGE